MLDISEDISARRNPKQHTRYSLFSTLDVPINQHLVQTRLDNCRHKSAIVSPNSLQSTVSMAMHGTAAASHLDTLRVHLVVLLGPCPVQAGISLLADKQIWEVNFLEFQFDRIDEFLRNY